MIAVWAFILGAPPALELSYLEALEASSTEAAEVRLAERRTELSAAEIAAAGALANPSFGIGTARLTARLTASMALPLPLFGQRSTAIEAAEADHRVATLGVRSARQEARLLTALAWLELWSSAARAALLEEAAHDAQRVQEIAEERFAAGSGARLDVLRSGADRARAGAEASAARGLIEAAAARLSVMVGGPEDRLLLPKGRPPEPAPLPSLEELLERVALHPALARDRAEIAAASAHRAREERQRWPILTPAVSVSALDPTTPGTDVIVGLGFELPLLSLRGGAIARAAAEESMATEAERLDARRLRAALRDAYRRTESSATTLKALREEVLPALAEAKAMTEEGYQSGRVDLLRVLEAARARLESQLAEVEAFAGWARAYAELEAALGTEVHGAR
ncbi:MAG: TolC family protein [Myxococcota bacterium]